MTSRAASSIVPAGAARSVTANGVTIHYDDLGSPGGVPVVLVHGHPLMHELITDSTLLCRESG